MAHIDDYRFGRIVIDGRAYTSDLILLPHRVVENWWREEGHLLHAADLGPVLELQPEVLVVGQGTFGRLSKSGALWYNSLSGVRAVSGREHCLPGCSTRAEALPGETLFVEKRNRAPLK